MFSWFPIYFPLKSPITVLENDLLTFAIWRKSDDYRVMIEIFNRFGMNGVFLLLSKWRYIMFVVNVTAYQNSYK